MLGPVERADKAKIDSLLYELRSWSPNEAPPMSLAELAQKFQLDPLVVKRVAQSEGWEVNGDAVPEEVSVEDTRPIDITKD